MITFFWPNMVFDSWHLARALHISLCAPPPPTYCQCRRKISRFEINQKRSGGRGRCPKRTNLLHASPFRAIAFYSPRRRAFCRGKKAASESLHTKEIASWVNSQKVEGKGRDTPHIHTHTDSRERMRLVSLAVGTKALLKFASHH